jgi:hypothetical protein
MKSSVPSTPSRKGNSTSAKRAKLAASSSVPKKRRMKSEVDNAIATELAPAAAIALLDKTEGVENSLAPALDALAAGVSPATDDSRVRVQLIFDGGEVLPVEMSLQAGEALAAGLSKELSAKP